jgi:hypothetical protein
LIAARFSQFLEFGATNLLVSVQGFGQNLHQHLVDISCHAILIAADIQVRALFDPLPYLGAALPEALLDVDLLRLVA